MTPSNIASKYGVLIVDDSPDYIRVLGRILRPQGYKVMTARSAEEGEVAIAERVPDIVLLDWNLPGKSGIEFAQRLRSDPRFARTVIVMLSVHSRPEEQAQGLSEARANAYMTKPVSPGELLARVEHLLRKRDGLPG
ncbi:MAG: response regulator [Elusimicrobia bacterium]|nr:response regulator [Elusimicrobiota bacterium]